MKKEIILKDILKLLEEASNQWISGKNLAEAENVSTRSIRNYIRELNQKGYIIVSSKKGYLFKHGKSPQDFSDFSSEEIRILKLLINSERGTTLYKISNSLFVSETTFFRKVQVLNFKLVKFHLKIQHDQKKITLKGNERDKRRLIYFLLTKERDKNILKEFHLEISQQKKLRKLLLYVLGKNSLKVSEELLVNILMHIEISLTRIQTAHGINHFYSERIKNKLKNSVTLKIAEEINNQIKKEFMFSLSEYELINLALLLLDAINHQPNKSNLSDLVESQFLTITLLIFSDLKEEYSLNFLSNKFFLIRFALHIQNLYYRLKENKNLIDKNCNKNIKENYPFIYDLAVSISYKLSKIFEQQIVESEIDYIAMHIGTCIMNKVPHHKYNMILIDHDYLRSNQQITEKINKKFENELKIRKIYQSYLDLPPQTNFLKVISTQVPTFDNQILSISPFLNSEDFIKIQERIATLNEQYEKNSLKKYVNSYLPKELTFYNIYFKNSTIAIKDLCQKMSNYLGEKDNNLEKLVLKRESLSSTTFVPNVAMPHPLTPITKKTVISFIINKKPMKWGNKFVRIIVFLALSRRDQSDFQHLFDTLISSLSDKKTIDLLLKSKNHKEIIEILSKNIFLEKYLQ